MLSSLWSIIDGSVSIFVSLYFLRVSKNQDGILIIGMIINVATLIMFWFFVPESPKWLYSKARYQECQQILTRIAKFNGKDLPSHASVFRLRTKIFENINVSNVEVTATDSKSPLQSIFGDKILRRNQVCMIIVWMGSSFSYYMLNMFVKYLKGDIFTN